MTPQQRPAATEARQETETKFLDAAERLLVEVGYAGISTRTLAAKAGANPGLVHYYFGSIEEVFLQVLDRFTKKLIDRQRAMYSADAPFLEKWRTAWRFQEQDLAAGYPKVWFELQAMAWNHPEMAERVAQVNAEWRGVLRKAFARALDEYGIAGQLPLEALTSMMTTFGIGYQFERLSGISEGHQALLKWIDDWIESLDRGGRNGRGKARRATGTSRGRRAGR